MKFLVPTMTIVSLVVDRFARRATIELRPRGLVAWVLGWFGLSRSQTYEADSEGYRVTTRSSTMATWTYIPWSHAAGCSMVRGKPTEMLFAGFGLMAGSLSFLLQQVWLQGGGMFLGGLLLVVVFFASQPRTSVAIRADSGAAEIFKVVADTEQLDRLHEYYALLRDWIARTEGVGVMSTRPEQDTSGAKRRTLLAHADDQEEEGDPRFTSCPHCQAKMKIKPAFVGRWANCPSCQQSFLVT